MKLINSHIKICIFLTVFLWNYTDGFSYCGFDGPDFWENQFPICGQSSQSPINVDDEVAVIPKYPHYSPKLEFSGGYEEGIRTLGKFVNNGHSIMFMPDANQQSSFVTGGPLKYEYYKFAQFHSHWGKIDCQGSEHTIKQKRYPLELHMVHYNTKYESINVASRQKDGLAVIGIFFQIDESKTACDEIFPCFEQGHSLNKNLEITLNSFRRRLLNKGTYFSYSGSLTTPPCLESVNWILFREPIPISRRQIEILRTFTDSDNKSIGDNFRPTQPLNNRTIFINYQNQRYYYTTTP